MDARTSPHTRRSQSRDDHERANGKEAAREEYIRGAKEKEKEP